MLVRKNVMETHAHRAHLRPTAGGTQRDVTGTSWHVTHVPSSVVHMTVRSVPMVGACSVMDTSDRMLMV